MQVSSGQISQWNSFISELESQIDSPGPTPFPGRGMTAKAGAEVWKKAMTKALENGSFEEHEKSKLLGLFVKIIQTSAEPRNVLSRMSGATFTPNPEPTRLKNVEFWKTSETHGPDGKERVTERNEPLWHANYIAFMRQASTHVDAREAELRPPVEPQEESFKDKFVDGLEKAGMVASGVVVIPMYVGAVVWYKHIKPNL